MSVTKEPWYTDIVNYLATSRIPSHWTTQDKHKFFAKVKYFIWDDSYLLSNVLTKSLEGVYQTMRLKSSYPFVMTKPAEVFLDPRKLSQKFSNVDSIGPIYLRTHMNTVKTALGVNK